MPKLRDHCQARPFQTKSILAPEGIPIRASLFSTDCLKETTNMTVPKKFASSLVPATIFVTVLLAASLSSGASVPVTHFQANGAFADAFACNNGNVCGFVSVFLGGSRTAPETFLFYAVSLPSGDQLTGFGLIPNANVTRIGSRTLTLANTDTSQIADFTNLLCDIEFNCISAAGGIVSGTWQRVNFFSNHSTSSSNTRFGNVHFTFNGTFDSSSATSQFSVLGNSFSGTGDIGTSHNTGVTVGVQ
jgi:hypothetical protein